MIFTSFFIWFNEFIYYFLWIFVFFFKAPLHSKICFASSLAGLTSVLTANLFNTWTYEQDFVASQLWLIDWSVDWLVGLFIWVSCADDSSGFCTEYRAMKKQNEIHPQQRRGHKKHIDAALQKPPSYLPACLFQISCFHCSISINIHRYLVLFVWLFLYYTANYSLDR